MDNTDPVVYGLDIGVYNLGARAQVLSSTTTAWCRFPCPPTSLDGLTYSGTPAGGSLKLSGGWSATCGRSIEELARAMTTDFKEGKSIALGFEAPMWFPTQREHSKSLSLFSPRFPEEAGQRVVSSGRCRSHAESGKFGLPSILPDRARRRALGPVY